MQSTFSYLYKAVEGLSRRLRPLGAPKNQTTRWLASYFIIISTTFLGYLLLVNVACWIVGKTEPWSGQHRSEIRAAAWIMERSFQDGPLYLIYGLVLLTTAYWSSWYFITCCRLGRLVSAGRLVPFVILASLGMKAISDVDAYYDTWLYHLPFAGRLWGLVSKEHYVFSELNEQRYLGFPLLGEFLQGFGWRLAGTVQGANLVCFGSLVLYLLFLRRYLGVPTSLAAAGLLAVPLIQIHASSCYVDLPPNLCLAALLLILFALETGKLRASREVALVAWGCAAVAGNMKHQHVPLVLVILTVLIWRQWKVCRLFLRSTTRGKRILRTTAAFLAMGIIFATSIKNLVVHANPFYPLGVQVFRNDVFLAANSSGPEQFHYVYDLESESRGAATVFGRWIDSVFEIGVPLFSWSIDQWQADPRISRLGGYFAQYVAFHLLLLTVLLWGHRGSQRVKAVLLLGLGTCLAVFMPFSFHLRYYMFWMVTLISLNLYFLAEKGTPESNRPGWIPIFGKMGIFLALLGLLAATKARYVRPQFYGLAGHRDRHVNSDVLNAVHKGERVTIVGAQPWTFLYAAPFYSRSDYRVQEAGWRSEEILVLEGERSTSFPAAPRTTH